MLSLQPLLMALFNSPPSLSAPWLPTLATLATSCLAAIHLSVSQGHSGVTSLLLARVGCVCVCVRSTFSALQTHNKHL